MKKNILLLLLLLLPFLSARAQFFRFGAKVGGGVTGIVGRDVPSDETKYYASMHVGFMTQYDFAPAFAIQPELLFVKKGFTYNNYPATTPNEVLSGDLRLDYLELPFMFKLRSGGLFAEFGPYAAYLLNVSSDVNIIDGNTANSPSPQALGPQAYNRSDFRSFDYGFAIGGGLRFENGFFLSARHTNGLRSNAASDLNQRNSVWQLSIGYLMASRFRSF